MLHTLSATVKAKAPSTGTATPTEEYQSSRGAVKKPEATQKEETAAAKKPLAAPPAVPAKVNPLEVSGSLFGGKPKAAAARVAKPASIPTQAAPTPPATKKDPPVQEPAEARPAAPVKQQEAAKPAAEAKLAPLAALSSLFGGKPKPNAAVAPEVKVAAKLAVKPVAAFSFFGKSTAPRPAPAATRTIETKAPPAATRVIAKELETTKLQANASPFAVFFAGKPKPTKDQRPGRRVAAGGDDPGGPGKGRCHARRRAYIAEGRRHARRRAQEAEGCRQARHRAQEAESRCHLRRCAEEGEGRVVALRRLLRR